MRANQLINESNTTGGVIKIWTGIDVSSNHKNVYLCDNILSGLSSTIRMLPVSSWWGCSQLNWIEWLLSNCCCLCQLLATRPKNILPSCRIAQLFCCRTITDWVYYDWIAEIKSGRAGSKQSCETELWGWSIIILKTDFLREEGATRPIFFCDPVILETICYRRRAYRLINESNTTGELRKIWTGRDNKHMTIFSPITSKAHL